jgi:hypothetical protein
MTYPLSSDVVPGQPTAADHYNNLRADALRLGQVPADSNNLSEILARQEQNLTIVLLGADRVRVPCSTAAPVALVVDGYFILRSTVNVDLPVSGKPSGSEDTWYVFAVRTPGSNSFSLEVNTSPLESSGRRLIGSFYWNGTIIPAPSIRTSLADTINSLTNHMQFTGCQGRLSLDSTSPVKDAENGGLFLHPYKGNLISLYTPGFGWNNYPIQINGTKPGIVPSTLTDHVYDVFAYWDGSQVRLESVVWTNSTSRATSLTFTEGMYLKSTDLTRLYLGTFLAYLNGDIKDQPEERGLWNFFNRVKRPLKVLVDTSSWTYNVPSTWRSPNDSQAMFRLVTGLPEDAVDIELDVTLVSASGLYGMVGIGIDSTVVNSADVNTHALSTSLRTPVCARYSGFLTIGCHEINWIEATSGTGTVTFYGSQFSGASQSGMTGQIWA